MTFLSITVSVLFIAPLLVLLALVFDREHEPERALRLSVADRVGTTDSREASESHRFSNAPLPLTHEACLEEIAGEGFRFEPFDRDGSGFRLVDSQGNIVRIYRRDLRTEADCALSAVRHVRYFGSSSHARADAPHFSTRSTSSSDRLPDQS